MKNEGKVGNWFQKILVYFKASFAASSSRNDVHEVDKCGNKRQQSKKKALIKKNNEFMNLQLFLKEEVFFPKQQKANFIY